MRQTLRIGSILMGLVSCNVMWAQDSRLAVVVEVHNDARMDAKTLVKAELEASRIFERAGLSVELVNCGNSETASSRLCAEPAGSALLSLRLLPRPLKPSGDIFGVAFLGEDGTGRYGDVFLSSAEKLHEDKNVGIAVVLGHVMAHEIGHLILGHNAHSTRGIMRARWETDEVKKLGTGTLLFTPDQQTLMQTRISARAGSADDH